ncbi:hypothetical protein QG37_07226 [Candidozyma auris]|nr:hypothetical protein QG37_07226 [[Candida] auris]
MRVDGRPEWFWEVEISQPSLAAPATKTVRIYVRGCENHQNNKHEQLNTNVKQIGIETEPYISGTCWSAGWPNYDTLYLIFVGARDHVTPASHVVLGALWPFLFLAMRDSRAISQPLWRQRRIREKHRDQVQLDESFGRRTTAICPFV